MRPFIVNIVTSLNAQLRVVVGLRRVRALQSVARVAVRAFLQRARAGFGREHDRDRLDRSTVVSVRSSPSDLFEPLEQLLRLRLHLLHFAAHAMYIRGHVRP